MGGHTARDPGGAGAPPEQSADTPARAAALLAASARRTPATSVAQARTAYELASVFRLAASAGDGHGMAAVLGKAWSSLGAADRARLLEYAEGALRDAQVAGVMWIDDAMVALDGRVPRECFGALSAHIAYSQRYGALGHSEAHTLERLAAGRDPRSEDLDEIALAAAREWGRLVGVVKLPPLPPPGRPVDERLYERPQVKDLVSHAAGTRDAGPRAFCVAALTAAAGGEPENERDPVRSEVVELVRRWPERSGS